MRRKFVAMVLAVSVVAGCVSGCGNSGEEASKTETGSTQQETAEETKETTAVSLVRSANPDTVSLNAEHVYEEKTGISWVKIATIWDPELILFTPESFSKGSKAIAVTFEVSNMDVDPTTCYWNYMIKDSSGKEISCWDTSYKTEDVEITGDGKYQMVFDYSKVEGGDVAELQSLQLVFPGMNPETTTQVTVTEAVCIMDEAEMGTVYKTGALE